jgi:hypothetical protein
VVFAGVIEERLEVVLHQLIEKGLLGAMLPVRPRWRDELG